MLLKSCNVQRTSGYFGKKWLLIGQISVRSFICIQIGYIYLKHFRCINIILFKTILIAYKKTLFLQVSPNRYIKVCGIVLCVNGYWKKECHAEKKLFCLAMYMVYRIPIFDCFFSGNLVQVCCNCKIIWTLIWYCSQTSGCFGLSLQLLGC